MHRDTISELIEAGTVLGGSMMKELFIRRQDDRIMEREAEMQKELIEARDRSSAQRSRRESGTDAATRQATTVSTQNTQESPAGVTVDLAPLVESETCGMCRNLLNELDQYPPDERAVGLAEYGMMKRAMDADDPEQAVRDVIEDSDVLGDAIAEMQQVA